MEIDKEKAIWLLYQIAFSSSSISYRVAKNQFTNSSKMFCFGDICWQ